MKIRIRLDNKTSPPRSMTMQHPGFCFAASAHADAEKLLNDRKDQLPAKEVICQAAPAGCDPDVGDITYYAPWGALAIFYKDAPYAHGLVKLAKIDGDVEALNTPGAANATIVLVR